MSCAAFSRPCSRSPWAASIATLPNTATAPVAAIATARARPARSSITATCGTALVIPGAMRRTSASVAFSGIGSSSSSAATRNTMPSTAAFGAASRIAVAAARQTAPPSASQRVPLSVPAPSFSRDRRERLARDDVFERAQHRHRGGEHPAARRRSRRSARSPRAASRPRTRRRGSRGCEWNRWIESSSPSTSPSTHASTPSTSASNIITPITVRGGYPSRRRSAISRRRWGTVSSIALNANRKPTSALITANSAVDWLVAAAARANSVSS